MGATSRPIAFLDFLPAAFGRQGEGDELLRRFLAGFEALFEELEDAIEGSPDGVLQLRVVASAADGTVTVEGFRPGPVPRPEGTVVTARIAPRQTTLAAPIPANARAVTTIEVSDPRSVAGLRPGRILEVGRVKTLSEPAIDAGKQTVGLVTLALLLPQPTQAHNSAQL